MSAEKDIRDAVRSRLRGSRRAIPLREADRVSSVDAKEEPR